MKFKPSKLAKCKNCGSGYVAWRQAKSGSYYLVNVVTSSTSGEVEADSTDFHSTVCGKAAFSADLPVAFEEPVIPEPSFTTPPVKPEIPVVSEPTPAPESQPSDLHMSLAEIEAKLTSLASKMDGFAAEFIVPVQEKATAALTVEQKLIEEFQKQIQQMRDERYAYEAEVAKFNAELAALQAEMKALTAEQAKTLQAIAAQNLLDAVNTKFLDLLANAPWAQLGKNLRPYQLEDVKSMVVAFEGEKSGVLNANDMGLGKTIESAALDYMLGQLFQAKHGRQPNVLWLTKKGNMKSSQRLLTSWLPERKTMVIEGNKPMREMLVKLAIANNAMVIANYDALKGTDLLIETTWDIIFMDEVHKLKGGANSGGPTLIWQNVRKLIWQVNAKNQIEVDPDTYKHKRRAEFTVMLSGSPIQNHPREMWSYLNLFDPARFPSVGRFERDFSIYDGVMSGYGEEQLLKALVGQVTRRRKTEVLVDLPDKEEVYHISEHTEDQAAAYQQMRDKFWLWIDEQEGKALTATAVIAQLTRLRQINTWGEFNIKNADGTETHFNVGSSGKVDDCMELIEDLVELGEQAIVWSAQFNPVLRELEKRINALNMEFDGSGKKVTCQVIDGSNSSKASEYENAFQQGEIHYLLINGQTGGEGLNLHKNPEEWPGGATNAIFMDRWWNPKMNEQMEDRIWGRTEKANEKVLIHVFHTEQSVDEFIAAILAKKEAMIAGIMDRDELLPAHSWKEMLQDLI